MDFENENIVVVASYHYLTLPIYKKLKNSLSGANVYCIFPNDMPATHVNRRYLESGSSVVKSDNNAVQLEYLAPWCSSSVPWEKMGRVRKFVSYLFYSLFVSKYRKHLISLVEGLNPTVILLTSDQFLSAKLLNNHFGSSRLILVQPCYLDLWEKDSHTSLHRTILQKVFPLFVPKQPIFGMELQNIDLLIWEDDSIHSFEELKRKTIASRHPLYSKGSTRSPLCSRHCVSFFLSDLSGIFGSAYQKRLNAEIEGLINWSSKRYRVIVKMHPNEDPYYWNNALNIDGSSVEWVTEFDRNDEVFSESRIVISFCSNVGVDALIGGCVSVNFMLHAKGVSKRFAERFERYVCRGFSDSEKLKSYIEDVMGMVNEKDLLKLTSVNLGASGEVSELEEILLLKVKDNVANR